MITVRAIAHSILFTISRSGLALLVYGYLRFWDMMAVAYGLPSMDAMSMLRENTPITLLLGV
jgi:hypothetical protein